MKITFHRKHITIQGKPDSRDNISWYNNQAYSVEDYWRLCSYFNVPHYSYCVYIKYSTLIEWSFLVLFLISILTINIK